MPDAGGLFVPGAGSLQLQAKGAQTLPGGAILSGLSGGLARLFGRNTAQRDTDVGLTLALPALERSLGLLEEKVRQLLLERGFFFRRLQSAGPS